MHYQYMRTEVRVRDVSITARKQGANCCKLSTTGEKKKEGGAVKAVMHDSNVTVIVHKWENGMRISRKHKRMEIFWSEDTAAMTTKKSVCV